MGCEVMQNRGEFFEIREEHLIVVSMEKAQLR